MKLYERDYTIFESDDEKKAYEDEKLYNQKKGFKSASGFPKISHPDMNIREFLWHKESLYPNNYIYFKNINYKLESEEFEKIICTTDKEQEIQSYIKHNRKWFIPGSIYLDYNLKKQDVYLFPEKELGSSYVVDYLLIGENSDGYSMVLIEFENANTEYIQKNNNIESDSVRKGIAQIKDWKRWLDSNKGYFIKEIGLSRYGIDIPTSRIYYYLVVSRRDLMDERAKELRSQLMYEMHNLKIVSFDRLVDNVCKI